jgi:hypothetical protein
MLGVLLNMAKHQGCAQTFEYSGFLFDTFRGLMQCTEEEAGAPADTHSCFGSLDLAWSTRYLNRVKGRLLHYSAAIRYLRIRVTEMQRLMGPLSETDSCASARVSPCASTVAVHYDLAGPLPQRSAPCGPCGAGHRDGRALRAAWHAALAAGGLLGLRHPALWQGESHLFARSRGMRRQTACPSWSTGGRSPGRIPSSASS